MANNVQMKKGAQFNVKTRHEYKSQSHKMGLNISDYLKRGERLRFRITALRVARKMYSQAEHLYHILAYHRSAWYRQEPRTKIRRRARPRHVLVKRFNEVMQRMMHLSSWRLQQTHKTASVQPVHTHQSSSTAHHLHTISATSATQSHPTVASYSTANSHSTAVSHTTKQPFPQSFSQQVSHKSTPSTLPRAQVESKSPSRLSVPFVLSSSAALSSSSTLSSSHAISSSATRSSSVHHLTGHSLTSEHLIRKNASILNEFPASTTSSLQQSQKANYIKPKTSRMASSREIILQRLKEAHSE